VISGQSPQFFQVLGSKEQFLSITSDQANLGLRVELKNQTTGELVALVNQALTAVCIRINPGKDNYLLKIDAGTTQQALASNYQLRLTYADPRALDCPPVSS